MSCTNSDDSLETLIRNKNPQRARQMKKYMRDQFDFLGIPAVKRRELARPFFKEAKKENRIDRDFLNTYLELPYRERQYIGSDYLFLKQNYLIPDDINRIKTLALIKPWWDTVDSLDKIIGKLALKHRELDQMLLEWSVDENLWLRRLAINH